MDKALFAYIAMASHAVSLVLIRVDDYFRVLTSRGGLPNGVQS